MIKNTIKCGTENNQPEIKHQIKRRTRMKTREERRAVRKARWAAQEKEWDKDPDKYREALNRQIPNVTIKITKEK